MKLEAASTHNDTPLRGVVVGRRRQHRLDVELVQGDLFDVPVRCYVLGVYANVVPSGPARFIDERTGGAVSEFAAQGLLPTVAGQVFMMPTGRSALRSEVILFTGLGPFDEFEQSSTSIQRLVTRNVIRTLISCGIDELATIVFGGSSGHEIEASLDALFRGVGEALTGNQSGYRFRRTVLCEFNAERYQRIRDHLYNRAARAAEFEDVEITIDEVEYPTLEQRVEATRAIVLLPSAQEQPIYLQVRLDETAPGSQPTMQMSALTAGGKASIVSGEIAIDTPALEKHLEDVSSQRIKTTDVDAYGRHLADLVVPPQVRELFKDAEFSRKHVVVIHNATASRIPWELVRFNDFPCLLGGLSRRHVDPNMSAAKWLKKQRLTDELSILLIVNPEEDLTNAAREGRAIRDVLRDVEGISVTLREGKEATKARILDDLQTEQFGVIHFAGHAFFDSLKTSRSGIRCHKGEVLHGRDLKILDQLPAVAIINGCQSGRVRNAEATPQPAQAGLEDNFGLAEAFLRGGVMQYVGTYWPVDDDAAKEFAVSFYRDLVQGESISFALMNARTRLKVLSNAEWANYLHYGPHQFTLKAAEHPCG